MCEAESYSKKELEWLVTEALKTSGRPAENLSLAELTEAAEAAGVESDKLREAVKKLEHRRRHYSLAWVLGVIAMLITIVLLFFTPPALRDDSIMIHNESSVHSYDVEVWVPVGSHTDCSVQPQRRFSPDEYELQITEHMPPRLRTRFAVELRSAECPQVWIKTKNNGSPLRSMVFELPVSVEIEVDGDLDQKGPGAPQMYPPPISLSQTKGAQKDG